MDREAIRKILVEEIEPAIDQVVAGHSMLKWSWGEIKAHVFNEALLDRIFGKIQAHAAEVAPRQNDKPAAAG